MDKLTINVLFFSDPVSRTKLHYTIIKRLITVKIKELWLILTFIQNSCFFFVDIIN